MTESTVPAPDANSPAPAPTPAPSPAPAPAPAGHGIAWLPVDADAETVGHVQNAGWDGPAAVVKSHRELQKLFGADRHGRTITVPKEDATPAEFADFYNKMGRPETPDGYKLPVPQGSDGEFAKQAAAWMHEAGVPLKAGQAIAGKWNEFVAARAKAEAEAAQAAFEAESAILKRDWGNEAMMRKDLARRAAAKLGIDDQAIDALEKAAGFSKTLKALARVGDMLSEKGAAGLDQPGSFEMTPEGASTKLTQLMADKAWCERARVNNSAEWAELSRLNGIIKG